MPPKTLTLTEEELRAFVREAAMAAAQEAVKQTLTSIGVEHGSPIEMQKDFQHLRDWRESVETVKRKSLIAIATILITGLLGAAWAGIKLILSSSHP